jgi:hypothetical protein
VIRFVNNPPWDKKPVPFADVYLLDTGHNPFDYTKSDANGNFKFSGLGYRSYYLAADVTGKFIQEKLVTLDSIYPVSDTVYLVVENIVTFSVDELTSIKNIKIESFPNPASNNLNILISSEFQGAYSLEILNMLGQVIYKRIVNIRNDKQSFHIDLRNIPSGIHLLSLKSIDGKVSGSTKFVKR